MVYAKSPNSNLDGLVTATCNFAISDLGFFLPVGWLFFLSIVRPKQWLCLTNMFFLRLQEPKKTNMTVCDVFFVFSVRASEHMKFFF